MTKKEIQEKTQAKVMQLKDLATKLQIRIIAHNAITQGNIIRPMVYFDDMEQYELDPAPEAIVRVPDAVKAREKMKDDSEKQDTEGHKENIGFNISLEKQDAENSTS